MQYEAEVTLKEIVQGQLLITVRFYNDTDTFIKKYLVNEKQDGDWLKKVTTIERERLEGLELFAKDIVEERIDRWERPIEVPVDVEPVVVAP